MSLKAGRVGVNPSDVDPVSGRINSSSTDAYTKAQADDKFLSKVDAASTYESKSDASTAHNQLQPKTLAVPIEMLSGTKLTVETALQGLNSDMQPKTLAVPIEMLSGTKLTVETALQGLNSDKQDKGSWTTPVELLNDTTYGSLKFSENVKEHLACIVFRGNSTAPSAIIDSGYVDIDIATEIPVFDFIASAMNHSTDNSIAVRLENNKTQYKYIQQTYAYTLGSLIYPTKPKTT